MNLLKNTMKPLIAACLIAGSISSLANDKGMFEVTVTNITGGEIFTPVMVASHRYGQKLFTTGEPASTELEMLAEGGDTGPLSDKLIAEGALDVVTSDGVLPPGQSVTLRVRADKRHDHVSVASMLVPSNDTFFAVNGIHGPMERRELTLTVPAYDAGTEDNDELCASIPGPPTVCAGEGYSAGGGEGYVYISPGIHGQGNLTPSIYDWRNPVAKISIRRVRK
ncbi:MAG: spondin domain-containing protein [Pseudomonadota bacterium]|nr:spondin domain-containing protein [Pseudomonadota bacterium]